MGWIQEVVVSAPDEGEARRLLLEQVRRVGRRADRGARSWSSVHHTAVFVSIVFSAGAAFLIKNPVFGLNATDAQSLAAVLALVSALMATLDVSLGFYRKWKVNVTTRTAAGSLLTTLETDPAYTVKDAGRRLNAINERHALGIISEVKGGVEDPGLGG
jgi:hypothetical protein